MTNHELTGLIIAKEPRKVYDKSSKYRGNSFYRIIVLSEPKQQEEYLFVYPNVVNTNIFQVIEQSQYVDHRYLFFCQKSSKRLILVNWRELPNNNAFIQANPKENQKKYEAN